MAPAAASSTKKSRRGTETRRRTRLLNLRLTPEEDERIRRASADTGIPMATLLRRGLMRELESI